MENGIIMILKKFKLLPIPGDASFRKYFRKFNPKKNLRSIIVISKKEKYKNLLVSSTINHFLLSKNIKALEGAEIAYHKPGFETDKSTKRILKSKELSEVLSIDDLKLVWGHNQIIQEQEVENVLQN